MRVPAYEHVERCVWQRLRCVLVSVCQEYPFSALHDDGVVRHHGKRQQHLIDLGVAVASDGYDSVRQTVKCLGYALWVDAFGYGVARPGSMAILWPPVATGASVGSGVGVSVGSGLGVADGLALGEAPCVGPGVNVVLVIF